MNFPGEFEKNSGLKFVSVNTLEFYLREAPQTLHNQRESYTTHAVLTKYSATLVTDQLLPLRNMLLDILCVFHLMLEFFRRFDVPLN